eukprot:2219015-Prymnesium_polylepis.1
MTLARSSFCRISSSNCAEVADASNAALRRASSIRASTSARARISRSRSIGWIGWVSRLSTNPLS